MWYGRNRKNLGGIVFEELVLKVFFGSILAGMIFSFLGYILYLKIFRYDKTFLKTFIRFIWRLVSIGFIVFLLFNSFYSKLK